MSCERIKNMGLKSLAEIKTALSIYSITLKEEVNNREVIYGD